MTDSDALVVAAHGRLFYLEKADGTHRIAVTRGKRHDFSVGDHVIARPTSADQDVIESLVPRRNELTRSDQWKSKRLAANLDQIGIVIAGSPPFSEELLARILIAAQAQNIDALIIANKFDLTTEHSLIEPRLACYEAQGYDVLRVATKTRPDETLATLLPKLRDRTTLLLGQSGMGKSTLINLLVPDAGLATQNISEALQTGKHTTTFTRLFNLCDDTGARIGRIVDSPGFQTFGLSHLSRSELMHGMRDVAPLLGKCRFHNCTHRDEPGCAITAAVEAGMMDKRRHDIYLKLIEDNLRS